ncbi:hypothetical protein PG997_012214 [Apiospora hydei]|uniref:Uncharacterized protein n=1 Tax=Apiospora hydei TaxID=1337664 RepID=A0ABR1V3E8_9PEZI
MARESSGRDNSQDRNEDSSDRDRRDRHDRREYDFRRRDESAASHTNNGVSRRSRPNGGRRSDSLFQNHLHALASAHANRNTGQKTVDKYAKKVELTLKTAQERATIDADVRLGGPQDMFETALTADKNRLRAQSPLLSSVFQRHVRYHRDPSRLHERRQPDTSNTEGGDVKDNPRPSQPRKIESQVQTPLATPATPTTPAVADPTYSTCRICKGPHPPSRCMQTDGTTGMLKVCPIHPHKENHYWDTCPSLLKYLTTPELVQALWLWMVEGRAGMPPFYTTMVDINEMTRNMTFHTYYEVLRNTRNYEHTPELPSHFAEKNRATKTGYQTVGGLEPEHGDLGSLVAWLGSEAEQSAHRTAN